MDYSSHSVPDMCHPDLKYRYRTGSILSWNVETVPVWLSCFLLGTKGVRPSTILAWPGWKQSDIPVEVDTARLETSRFKKCCANCVLLYFPSTEFKSSFNVYCRVILYPGT